MYNAIVYLLMKLLAGKRWKSSQSLCRTFIHDRLYNKNNGYFVDDSREVVHSPKAPISFQNLWGKYEYKATLTELYSQEKEAWLTPSEVFAPWYSRALAKYMLSCPVSPLNIYEIGGGSGSNASHILDYIQQYAPDIYQNMKYTLIEISPRLAKRQEKRISKHSNVCTVVCQDMLDADQQKVTENCFVLALEVLDNLPHDKVTWKHGNWYQTMVGKNAQDGSYYETLSPLQDPLVEETIQHFPLNLPLQTQYKYNYPWMRALRRKIMSEKRLDAAFVPTGCMQLLKVLKEKFPNHRLIASDFDQLPPPNLAKDTPHPVYNHPKSPTSTASGSLHAVNAPIVASKVSGQTYDHDTYLIPHSNADIFFPTDFINLKRAYCSFFEKNPKQVSVVKSRALMENFAEINQTKTILGYVLKFYLYQVLTSSYNPLLDDYANTSFLLS